MRTLTIRVDPRIPLRELALKNFPGEVESVMIKVYYVCHTSAIQAVGVKDSETV